MFHSSASLKLDIVWLHDELNLKSTHLTRPSNFWEIFAKTETKNINIYVPYPPPPPPPPSAGINARMNALQRALFNSVK